MQKKSQHRKFKTTLYQSTTNQFAFEQKVLVTNPRERWVTNPKSRSQNANHDCPKENERAITGHNQEQPQKKTPTSLSDNC